MFRCLRCVKVQAGIIYGAIQLAVQRRRCALDMSPSESLMCTLTRKYARNLRTVRGDAERLRAGSSRADGSVWEVWGVHLRDWVVGTVPPPSWYVSETIGRKDQFFLQCVRCTYILGYRGGVCCTREYSFPCFFLSPSPPLVRRNSA